MNIVLRGGRVIDPSTGEDAVRDVWIEGRAIVKGPSTDVREIDCAGMVVAPAFIDLHACVADPRTDCAEAVEGGFGTVVASAANPGPIEHPAVIRDWLNRAADAPCRLLAAGALTVGLQGEEIADVRRLVAAGASVVSNAGTPIKTARSLRHLLEYAGRAGRPIFLRAADAGLEAGGVVREGSAAAFHGLPTVPPEAEEIGIATVAALVRRTGVPVHLTHLWSERGVMALRRARSEGLPVTASTTAYHLALGDRILDEHAYAGFCRFVPPLGDDADREALAEAVRDGTIAAVASDHRPVPLHLQDRELEIAAPGVLAHAVTFALTLGAIGDLVGTIRALTAGPARILGRTATLVPGSTADLVVLDPNAEIDVTRTTFATPIGGTPLLGRRIRGRVVRTLLAKR